MMFRETIYGEEIIGKKTKVTRMLLNFDLLGDSSL